MANLILVGLDGSEASKRALDFAIELAAPPGKALHLVHVVDWSPFVIETFEENEYRGAIRKSQVEKAEREILGPAAARAEAAGVTCRTEVVFGGPADEVVELARKHGAESIVLGRTGTSALERLMFGSKANKIIQLADVPITIVP